MDPPPTRGIELSAFRRSGTQKAQRIFVLIFLLLCTTSLLITVIATSIGELVQYSVSDNVAVTPASLNRYRNIRSNSSSELIVLVPKVQIFISYTMSCLAGRCFSRSSTGVPSLFPTADALEEKLSLHFMYLYLQARRNFNIGYNFAGGCSSDGKKDGTKTLSHLVLAAQILTIIALFVAVCAGLYLYMQLKDPLSFYHRLNRKHLVCYPNISVDYLDKVVNKILSENSLCYFALQFILFSSFVSFCFSLCALCCYINIYWRPGCFDGFCTEFISTMTDLLVELNASSTVKVRCDYGKSVYLCIVFFVMNSLIFFSAIGLRIHFWLDDKHRQVRDAVAYLVDLRDVLMDAAGRRHPHDVENERGGEGGGGRATPRRSTVLVGGASGTHSDDDDDVMALLQMATTTAPSASHHHATWERGGDGMIPQVGRTDSSMPAAAASYAELRRGSRRPMEGTDRRMRVTTADQPQERENQTSPAPHRCRSGKERKGKVSLMLDEDRRMEHWNKPQNPLQTSSDNPSPIMVVVPPSPAFTGQKTTTTNTTTTNNNSNSNSNSATLRSPPAHNAASVLPYDNSIVPTASHSQERESVEPLPSSRQGDGGVDTVKALIALEMEKRRRIEDRAATQWQRRVKRIAEKGITLSSPTTTTTLASSPPETAHRPHTELPTSVTTQRTDPNNIESAMSEFGGRMLEEQASARKSSSRRRGRRGGEKKDGDGVLAQGREDTVHRRETRGGANPATAVGVPSDDPAKTRIRNERRGVSGGGPPHHRGRRQGKERRYLLGDDTEKEREV